MNKPLTIVIKETKSRLISACNESGLPPIILDLIVQNIYDEIHSLAEKQIYKDETEYAEIIKNKDINDTENG